MSVLVSRAAFPQGSMAPPINSVITNTKMDTSLKMLQFVFLIINLANEETASNPNLVTLALF